MKKSSYRFCGKCTDFSQFYVIDSARFKKSNYGICKRNNNIVEIKNYCDLFSRKPNITVHSFSLRYCLHDILEQIYAVKAIVDNINNQNDCSLSFQKFISFVCEHDDLKNIELADFGIHQQMLEPRLASGGFPIDHHVLGNAHHPCQLLLAYMRIHIEYARVAIAAAIAVRGAERVAHVFAQSYVVAAQQPKIIAGSRPIYIRFFDFFHFVFPEFKPSNKFTGYLAAKLHGHFYIVVAVIRHPCYVFYKLFARKLANERTHGGVAILRFIERLIYFIGSVERDTV